MTAMLNAFTGSSNRGGIHSLGAQPIEYVQRSNEMRRLLAFAGRSIDEVVNCPVARREVISYFRIGHQMRRLTEIDALERQWNPLGRH